MQIAGASCASYGATVKAERRGGGGGGGGGGEGARASLMHVTPDMTLQSHLYLYNASAAIPLHKRLNKKQVQ